MFEKKDNPAWKGFTLILTGVIVLVGGIFIGQKTTQANKTAEKPIKHEQRKEETKEAFKLNKGCEIWLHKEDSTTDVASDTSSVMLGTVPNGLLNKSKKEVVSYLKEKYPDKKVESVGKYEIVLSENDKKNSPTLNDKSKANMYTIKENDGYICLYKYDNKGKGQVVEKTQMEVNSLPMTVQKDIEKGIYMNSEEEAYSTLEDFSS